MPLRPIASCCCSVLISLPSRLAEVEGFRGRPLPNRCRNRCRAKGRAGAEVAWLEHPGAGRAGCIFTWAGRADGIPSQLRSDVESAVPNAKGSIAREAPTAWGCLLWLLTASICSAQRPSSIGKTLASSTPGNDQEGELGRPEMDGDSSKANLSSILGRDGVPWPLASGGEALVGSLVE